MKPFLIRVAQLSAGMVLSGTLLAQAKVDDSLPVYEKTSGVAGNLSSVG